MAIILAITFIWIIVVCLLLIKKNIHLLEIIFLICTTVIVNQLFCSFLQANLKWIEPYDTATAKAIIILQRTILIPLLTMYFLNLLIGAKKKRNKVIIFLVQLVIVYLIEELCGLFHIMRFYVNHLYLAFFQTTLLLIVGLISFKYFRSLLRQEVDIP
ncbi:hypothetical protein ACNRWW_07495 [Metabacillus sp. HB246100]|uniref:hypothetical protein n=1 Tax=Bacillus weihaiensis TaxID=1547283 RepID=UPI002352D1A9|nr:hypothetical protein [Bacillus weihaiensis]